MTNVETALFCFKKISTIPPNSQKPKRSTSFKQCTASKFISGEKRFVKIRVCLELLSGQVHNEICCCLEHSYLLYSIPPLILSSHSTFCRLFLTITFNKILPAFYVLSSYKTSGEDISTVSGSKFRLDILIILFTEVMGFSNYPDAG